MEEVMNGILIREVETKNIMTKSSLPVGGYSVNPYVGCTHACPHIPFRQSNPCVKIFDTGIFLSIVNFKQIYIIIYITERNKYKWRNEYYGYFKQNCTIWSKNRI